MIHLLDYVGVDYPESVKDGRVLDQADYQEQREFAAQSIALLEQLPAASEKSAGRTTSLMEGPGFRRAQHR